MESERQVYISKDFLDLGSCDDVDQALCRLVKDNAIRRIGRGFSIILAPTRGRALLLSPDADLAAQAVARRRGGHFQPSGAAAANALGLSTQVPGRTVYLTDSSSDKVRFGERTLVVKHISQQRLASGDKVTGPVLQALYFIGKDGFTDHVVSRLRSTLSDKDRKKLLLQSHCRRASSQAARVL